MIRSFFLEIEVTSKKCKSSENAVLIIIISQLN